MKAILYSKKNKPSKLIYTDIQKPIPADNQVLIKINAVSINAADYRSLKMGMVPKKKIFGAAITGTIESTGINTVDFKIGDNVIGDLSDFGFGGLAEFAVAPEFALTIKPKSLPFEEAVTLPIAATTALKALRDKGNIQKNLKVLIIGGSGGVGTFALQLAKYYGAHVTNVCSSKNIEQSISLGADIVIDYNTTDISQNNERYDLILAINGNYSLLTYKKLLKASGVYVMIGGKLKQIMKSIFFGWLFSFGSKKMRYLSAKSDPKDLEFVAKLMDEKKIHAIIEKKYPLEKAQEAFDYISSGHASGKIIIEVQ